MYFCLISGCRICISKMTLTHWFSKKVQQFVWYDIEHYFMIAHLSKKQRLMLCHIKYTLIVLDIHDLICVETVGTVGVKKIFHICTSCICMILSGFNLLMYIMLFYTLLCKRIRAITPNKRKFINKFFLNSWWGTYFSCYHMNNAIHNLFCSYYICTGIFICTGLCICRGVVAQWYKKNQMSEFLSW